MYVDRGERFLKAGKLDDASLQFEKAIQKSPNLGEAYFGLGKVDLAKGRPGPAYQNLQRAAELMPSDTEVISRFGQLALSLYNADPKHPAQLFEEASRMADQLMRKAPASFEANLLNGAIALAAKRSSEAVALLRKAVEMRPDLPEAKLGLARALTQDNQAAAGVEMAQELVKKDKEFGGSYDFLFERYRAEGKTEEATNILKLKVANNPKQAAFLLELARYLASAGKTAEMNATIAQLTGNPKDFPDGRLIAGDFYTSINNADEAVKQYEAGLAQSPKAAIVYHKRLLRIFSTQRKWPETYKQLDAVLKADPSDEEAKTVRALVWLDEAKPENLDPAIAELKLQAAKHGQDPLIHFQLGSALARKKDLDGARREWTAAAQQGRSYLPARFALVQLDLEQGRNDEALQVADEIMAVIPKDPRARLMFATCLTSAGQFQRARTELNKLASEFPGSPDVRFRFGVLAIAEHKFADAEDIFRHLETGGGPANPQVLAGLAQAYEGQNQPGKAIEMLQGELKRNPNSPAVRQILARLAMITGNFNLAIEQYQQLASATPKSADLQRSLAAAYTAKGDSNAAVETLKKALENDPKSALVSLQLAQAYAGSGRSAEAKALYRKLLENQPNNANALNDLAYLMADSGENLDQALTMAQKGLENATSPSLKLAVSDTLGWIYLKKKMYDSALQTFESLVRNNPNDPTYRYHLGATLYQTGDKQKAKAELEAALAAKPASPDETKIRELLSRL